MDKQNGSPQSAFAVYSKINPNSSLESNKSKRKNKNKKSKTSTNETIAANLKIPLKSKEKQKKNAPVKQMKNKEDKKREQVLENLSPPAEKENINGNGLNVIKFNSKKKPKNDIPLEKLSSKSNSSKKKKSSYVLKADNREKSSSSKTSNQNELNNSNQNIVKAIGTRSMDSVKTGKEIFQWLINPVDVAKFFRVNWEQQPIIIQRACTSYYSYLLSSNDVDYVLRKEKLYFGKNIDVTSYSSNLGVRENHSPGGQATAPLVWDYFANGCSIRILNPQTFFPKIHALNAALQEYFDCFVGANVYLTPPGTQGFAPHFDDIEAFVIQLEGSKLWKLYLPRKPAEVLPRYSSRNFTEADLGPPIEEVLLHAGDMIYFPRGIIHQASALEDKHSLHITLSMYQKNSWADFLETLLPAALKCAIDEDVSFREGLPMHYLSHLGLVHSDKTTKIRSEFLNKLQDLMGKIVTHAPVDAAADQLGKRFIHDSLPPFLRKWEMRRTVAEDGDTIVNGEIKNRAEVALDTPIKLIRYNCVRLVNEEDTIRVYYSVANSKEYHAEEPQYLEIEEDCAPIIDALINSYPNFITVEELPIDDEIVKVNVVGDLWYRGIVMTGEPLGDCSSDDE